MCICTSKMQNKNSGGGGARGCTTPPSVSKLTVPTCRILQKLSKVKACHVAYQ